eukprot:gene12518-biopygen7589
MAWTQSGSEHIRERPIKCRRRNWQKVHTDDIVEVLMESLKDLKSESLESVLTQWDSAWESVKQKLAPLRISKKSTAIKRRQWMSKALSGKLKEPELFQEKVHNVVEPLLNTERWETKQRRVPQFYIEDAVLNARITQFADDVNLVTKGESAEEAVSNMNEALEQFERTERSAPALEKLGWPKWDDMQEKRRVDFVTKIFKTGEPEVLKDRFPSALKGDMVTRAMTRGELWEPPAAPGIGEKPFGVWAPRVYNAGLRMSGAGALVPRPILRRAAPARRRRGSTPKSPKSSE